VGGTLTASLFSGLSAEAASRRLGSGFTPRHSMLMKPLGQTYPTCEEDEGVPLDPQRNKVVVRREWGKISDLFDTGLRIESRGCVRGAEFSGSAQRAKEGFETSLFQLTRALAVKIWPRGPRTVYL